MADIGRNEDYKGVLEDFIAMEGLDKNDLPEYIYDTLVAIYRLPRVKMSLIKACSDMTTLLLCEGGTLEPTLITAVVELETTLNLFKSTIKGYDQQRIKKTMNYDLVRKAIKMVSTEEIPIQEDLFNGA